MSYFDYSTSFLYNTDNNELYTAKHKGILKILQYLVSLVVLNCSFDIDMFKYNHKYYKEIDIFGIKHLLEYLLMVLQQEYMNSLVLKLKSIYLI